MLRGWGSIRALILICPYLISIFHWYHLFDDGRMIRIITFVVYHRVHTYIPYTRLYTINAVH
jgi:hypothetical protein